jgi:hypothetical protein
MFIIAMLLVAAWLIGLVAFKVTATVIHVLLLVAVVLFVSGFLRRRGGRATV